MEVLLTCPVLLQVLTLPGAGTDIITGGSADDTIVIAISAEGNIVNAGAGSDTLQLSSGVHTLTTDNKLLNVETVKTMQTDLLLI